MSYKSQLLSLRLNSGDARSVEKQITHCLLGKELFFKQLTNQDARRLQKKIDAQFGGSYTKTRDFARNNTEKRQPEVEPHDSQLTTHDSEPHAIEVYDAQAGKLVKRTPEQQQTARLLYGQMKMAEILQAIVLKQFLDGDHHLDLGFSSKEQFYQVELRLSRGMVSQKLRVAEKFQDVIPLKITGDVKPVLHQKQLSEPEEANLEKINQIGMSTWLQFARVEDADFSEILTEGIVTFSDGREVPLEEIQARTRREWEQIFGAETGALTEKLNKYKREKDEAEADARKLRDEIKAREDHYMEAARKEMIYGPKEMGLSGHYKRIELARERLTEAGKVINSIRLPEDETQVPADLHNMVVMLFNQIMGYRNILFDHNHMYIRGQREDDPFIRFSTNIYAADPKTGEYLGLDENPEPDPEEPEKKIIRTDRSRMAIKYKSTGKRAHGWKNLENGFETEQEMEDRFRQLLEDPRYEEG